MSNFTWAGFWDNGTSYQVNTFVTYENVVYVSLNPNISSTPSSGNTDWDIVVYGQGSTYIERTPLPTITPTQTITPSLTPNSTETPTPTPTLTPTKTPTNTPTSSETPTPTVTETPTNTPTQTQSGTPDITVTPTLTPTNTETPTNTPTLTETPTNTPSQTQSGTPNATTTPTNTPSQTQSGTPSVTSTPTVTPSQTNTPTNTATPTNTPTITPTSNIVTNGLVIQLDAYNSSSYPGTGTTVYDITSGYNHTLNGATFTTLNTIKCFDCTTGTNRAVVNGTGPTLPTSGYTYITWTRMNSSTAAFKTLLYTNTAVNKITPITIPNGGNTLGYWDTQFRTSGYDASSAANVWVQFAIVGDNSSQAFYINGSQVGSTIAYGAGGTPHWGWGNNDLAGQPWGYVANMYLYNRKLSLSEITQQYNFLSPRFVEPTPTPTATQTLTPTNTPSQTQSGTPNVTTTPTNTPTKTVTPSVTQTPTPTTPHGTVTFNYTGAETTWTIPAGVTSFTATTKGASGGSTFSNATTFAGGTGANQTAVITGMTPGTVLRIVVGQAGVSGGTATFGNGGSAGGVAGTHPAGSGGGLSSIYSGTAGFTQAKIITMAGGGGGAAAPDSGTVGSTGGDGGTPNGGNASVPGVYTGANGLGASTSAGGAAASGSVDPQLTAPQAGSAFQGGNGGVVFPTANNWSNGGGGGGGYYGGGGGWGGGNDAGGGGGGSSFVRSNSSVSYGAGNVGNGQIVITY